MTAVSKQIKLDFPTRMDMANKSTKNSDANIVNKDITLVMDSSVNRASMPLKQYFKTTNPQIVLITQGECSYEIGLEDFDLRAGDIFVNPLGTLFRFKKRSDDIKEIVLDFDIPQAERHDFFIYDNTVVRLSKEDYKRITKYFELLYEILKSSLPIRYSANQVVLSLLFDIRKIYAQTSKNIIANASKQKQLYNRFMRELLKDRKVTERKLDFYAKELKTSAAYLGNTVRKVSGIPASEWIARYTVSQAKYYLKLRQFSMTEIARLCGFSDQTAFSRFFKNRTDMSPKDYQDFPL